MQKLTNCVCLNLFGWLYNNVLTFGILWMFFSDNHKVSIWILSILSLKNYDIHWGNREIDLYFYFSEQIFYSGALSGVIDKTRNMQRFSCLHTAKWNKNLTSNQTSNTRIPAKLNLLVFTILTALGRSKRKKNGL